MAANNRTMIVQEFQLNRLYLSTVSFHFSGQNVTLQKHLSPVEVKVATTTYTG